MPWLGFVSLVCFTVCYIPQLLRTYRTRDVTGVSVLYWTILVIGYASGLFYDRVREDRLLWLTYAAGLCCCAAMGMACWLFRKR